MREAIDLAIDRPALVEIAMEGLGAPVNQLVTAEHRRLQQDAAAAEARRRQGQDS